MFWCPHTRPGTTQRIQWCLVWCGVGIMKSFILSEMLSLFCSVGVSVNIYLGYFSLISHKIVYHLFITKFCPAPALLEVFLLAITD